MDESKLYVVNKTRISYKKKNFVFISNILLDIINQYIFTFDGIISQSIDATLSETLQKPDFYNVSLF